MKAEDIEGYRGKEDIDAILSFIEAEVMTQSLHCMKILIENSNANMNLSHLVNTNVAEGWEEEEVIGEDSGEEFGQEEARQGGEREGEEEEGEER